MEGGNIMSYQKCPICNGTGDNPFVLELPRSTWPCPTCKGTRIISELTGLPPVVEEHHNIFEPVDPCESDEQHKWVCDLMENRHKIKPTQTTTQDGSNISSRES
jgi:hypothetical protein